MKTKQIPLSPERISPHSGRLVPLKITFSDEEQYVGIGIVHLEDGINRKKRLVINFDWLVRVQPASAEMGVGGLDTNPVSPITETFHKHYRMEFEDPFVAVNPSVVETGTTIGTADRTTIGVLDGTPGHLEAVQRVRDLCEKS